MKRFFNYFFYTWKRPANFFAISFIFYVVGAFFESHVIQNIAGTTFLAGCLELVISIIHYFSKGDRRYAVYNIAVAGAGFIAFIIFSVFLFFFDFMVPTDSFADKLTIPTNIKIEDPVSIEYGDGHPDSITTRKITKTDLQLYNAFQPGLFEYDVWISNIGDGTVYLKAYEVTENTPLSEYKLFNQTVIDVHNMADTFVRFGTSSTFTIYEGDWGKPYAARFEVWFIPANGGNERKLIEKNYKIEGWER
ncbi:hypothetical protein CJD36_016655 [Flavipsychrobacter stenotrophus]|uniref:Uncharacterized protein n=1 Tax=Flavipsychrobacter stenotrophus TaxID=2077091 RepID=A0A2S7SRN5_9BACT|nr:hypothetical protein [Flavipsychrobacter stenotrophus]PQJ09570.1 hypothetical protein CJD36_016655 [Flavipsychrobacter stenotrophus]